MNPDRRAEIGPQNGLSSEPHSRVSGNLPYWANPVLAARLTLATLTGLGAVAVDQITSPIVTAQTICKGQLTVLGIKFADHPNLGRNRIVDPTDFYLGNGDFNVVEIYDAAGKTKFDAWDGKDLAKKPKPIASGNMSDKGTHSIANIALSGDCDENQQGSAKRVWLTFPSDKNRVIYPEVVGNNRLRVHIAGRNEYRITELQGVANNGNFPIEKVGEVIARITKKLGTPVSFADPEQLKGDAKTISEANRKSLREQIAKLVQEQEKEKKPPILIPPATAAVTSTASSELVQAKLDQLASQIAGQIDKIDKKLTDIEGKLPVAPPKSTPGTQPGTTPKAEDGGLLDGALGAAGFVLDLPAKAVDQFTEPDTQFPLRAGIDVLAWLALLTPLKLVKRLRYVGVPGAYILGTSLYPIRYGIAKRKHNRDVAATAVGQQAPKWKRPTLSI